MLLVAGKLEVVIPLWLVKESKYVADDHATAVPMSIDDVTTADEGTYLPKLNREENELNMAHPNVTS